MKLTSIETLRLDQHANLLIVRLTTDEGLIGLGETFYTAGAVETYIHEELASGLLGMDVSDPLRWKRLGDPYVGYQGSGVEMRARGAVDIAAWDLLGHITGQPLVRLLGGAMWDDLPIYNTCAGAGYVQGPGGQSTGNWGLGSNGVGRYEDLQAFLTRPGELAADLVDQGIGGMKIWPFDSAAEKHRGHRIDHFDLARGVGTVEAIRDAVGDRIDVMIELHGLWDLPTASRIATALEDLDIAWLEDPIRPDHVESLARLAERTSIPIAGGETVTGAGAYRRLLSGGAVSVPIVDPSWAGGLSEALRVASVVASFGLPFATHDCTGPISLAACTHFSLSQQGTLVQETVRAAYYGWYSDIVTGLPQIGQGRISVSEAPGLGVALLPEIEARPGVHLRVSRL